MISNSLSTSERWAALHSEAGKLAEFCQVLFVLLVSHADDHGRLKGSPFTVKHLVIPTSPRSLESVERALAHLHQVNLILWYEHEGDKFIQINQFGDHQTLKGHDKRPSKCPDPPNFAQSRPTSPKPALREEKRSEEKRSEENLSETYVCVPRAREENPAGPNHTTVALAGTLPRDHLRHAWCSSRGKCVPDFLHQQFRASVGGESKAADQRLWAFYEAVQAGWPDGAIGDDPVKLWRQEFAAKFPSVAPASGKTAGNYGALSRFAKRGQE